MLIYHLSNDQFKAFIRLVQLLFNQHISHDLLVSLKEKLPIQSRDDLVMNGSDLIQFFPERKQGAWIRTLLNTIEEKVVTGMLENNDHEIKEWLKWNQPEVD
jgi:tRNA nucleotidyltransferase (CCA-adding enzyme)